MRSEIDFIKAYNKVQKIRYPNAFYLVYDVEEEIMEERIPPLIIQNFVENSTKYAHESRYRDRDSCDCAKEEENFGSPSATTAEAWKKRCWRRSSGRKPSEIAAASMWAF